MPHQISRTTAFVVAIVLPCIETWRRWRMLAIGHHGWMITSLLPCSCDCPLRPGVTCLQAGVRLRQSETAKRLKLTDQPPRRFYFPDDVPSRPRCAPQAPLQCLLPEIAALLGFASAWRPCG